MAAYVYETRTNDKTGANHMLGAAPPGTDMDLAPEWMVSASTTFSRTEAKRNDAVASETRRRKGDQGKGEKGKGGGKGKKGKKGDAPTAHS